MNNHPSSKEKPEKSELKIITFIAQNPNQILPDVSLKTF